jgi:hypothetical protein
MCEDLPDLRQGIVCRRSGASASKQDFHHEGRTRNTKGHGPHDCNHSCIGACGRILSWDLRRGSLPGRRPWLGAQGAEIGWQLPGAWSVPLTVRSVATGGKIQERGNNGASRGALFGRAAANIGQERLSRLILLAFLRASSVFLLVKSGSEAHAVPADKNLSLTRAETLSPAKRLGHKWPWPDLRQRRRPFSNSAATVGWHCHPASL